MKCPTCKTKLITKEIGDVNVLLCPSCEGIFLHAGELKKITHPTAGDIEYSSLEYLNKSRVSEFVCPACTPEKMIDVNFASFSDIIMKYCQKCSGIWLDKDELKQINAEIDKLNHEVEPWEHSFRVFLAKLPF